MWETLSTVMMGDQNQNRFQTLDFDSLFSSEVNEGDTASETMQQNLWCPAMKFSEHTTSVPKIEPWTKKLPRYSHLVYDADVQMSDWTPEETDNWMRLTLAAAVVWSMRTCRFSPQGEEQHIAGIVAAAAPCHRPMGSANSKPLVVFTLPGDFFNFMEEEEPDNSLNRAE